MKEAKKILKEQLKLIIPSKEELNKINKISKDIQSELSKKLKKNKIKAEVFLGGSLAKNTLVKKDFYDIDIFIRFDKSYNNKISSMLGKLLKNSKKIHGSRDYYQKKIDNIFIEIIPVLKIKKPEESENVTDLSYFHVKYLLNKIKKDKNLINEICIAKSFTHAQNVYGAESYINGFSGYALELLIIHYKTFINFIKEIAKFDLNSKLIIDQEKVYKNSEEILQFMNPSKTNSPIILIDPTYKERNALSSLSKKTLQEFQKVCINFLKNPSKDFFIKKNISEEFKNENAKIIKIKINKQPGDIAGTKSKKFYNFLSNELKKEFIIAKEGFEYIEDNNSANLYLLLKKKSPTEIKGPPIKYEKNVKYFSSKHKKTFVKGDYIYTILNHDLTFEDWFNNFSKEKSKIIKEMGVVELRCIKY